MVAPWLPKTPCIARLRAHAFGDRGRAGFGEAWSGILRDRAQQLTSWSFAPMLSFKTD